MKKYLLAAIFIFTFINSGRTQVIINEYSAANVNGITTSTGDHEDWVEVFNTSNTAVDLVDYFLSDDENVPDKWQFPSMLIPANGYQVVFCSGLNFKTGNEIHTNFKLTQTKYEPVILSYANGALADSVYMIPTQKNHSRGRTTDNAATWSLFTTPNPGSTNGGSIDGYVPTPLFDTPPGFYSGPFNVSIACADVNAQIYYTLDGSDPNNNSTLYSGAINIASTSVLRARAYNTNTTNFASFIESATFFINVNHTVPVVSVFGSQVLDLLNGNQIDPETGLQFFGVDQQMKAASYGESNEHGNDSWSYDQRGIDFISRDQLGYNYAIKDQLFPGKDRKSFQRIILKAAANDNYPFENGGAHIRDGYVHTLSQLGKLNLDERTNLECVMYANGQYWGVYDLREKVDDADFTDHYYKQDEPYVQYIQTWGGTWAAYGGNQALSDWNSFMTFATTNNLAIQSNYDYVDSVYNVKSLVDYFILNSFVVCKDWLNWNTSWWRGLDPAGDKKKWRYTLWDMDATFGHYINYTGIPNTGTNADPCDPNSLSDPGGQGHVPILNALMANDNFKKYYINRYVDLVNSTFNCTYMQQVLDSMVAVIEPEMDGQCLRWGGTKQGWLNNVKAMKDFIDARCIDLQGGFIDCYQLKGPYNITVDVKPNLSGNVKFNSLLLQDFMWQGSYFGNIELDLAAIPFPGYQFDHWVIDMDTVFPTYKDSAVTLTLDTNVNMIAIFKLVEDTTELKDEIFIPSAFSPDGDSYNDVFIVHGRNIAKMEMEIYNRWGELLFRSDDPNKGWNGTYKDRKLLNDVYSYQIKIITTSNKIINKKGTVTLMH